MADEPNILLGCAELPPGMGRERYFQSLRLLEVNAFFRDAPPALKSVRAWREKSPASARFSLLATRALTHPRGFATDAAAVAEAERLAAACQALEAEAVVFRTPPQFAPSQSGRAAVERFFEEVATAERFGATERVWDPDGLWELGAVAGLCERLDILGALDPLANDPLDELPEVLVRHAVRGKLYLRPTGLGRARRRFESHEIDALADIVDACERAWVVFGNPEKFRDALALARVLGQDEPAPRDD